MNINIEFQGVEFEVEFDYQPEEAAVMYYADGSGYPGCSESFEIREIDHEGYDWYDIFEASNKLDKITELVGEAMEKKARELYD